MGKGDKDMKGGMERKREAHYTQRKISWFIHSFIGFSLWQPKFIPGQFVWDLWWTRWHWGRFTPSTWFSHPILIPPSTPFLSSIIQANAMGHLLSKYQGIQGARGSIVGWGTMPQAGRSQVQFPVRLLDFSIDLILPAALWPWGRPLTEMSTRNLPGCKGRLVHQADNQTAICEPVV
jgi:hypothetical protein